MKRNFKEVIAYLVFGVLTTVVNIIVYMIMADWLHVHYLVSNAVAWFVSVLFAFLTNRKYVFRSKSAEKTKELARFFSSRLATLALDMAIMWLLVDVLTADNLTAKIIANVVVIIVNYILSKFLVFQSEEFRHE
ncbi:GtrA family protein [Faecalibaculum rodentium]|uniref:GtrA family protein n=1 Tax=Faecalibaculum rodentium TaxID=1702221 RepID=UPI0023F07367|nr:GtrA family protein [Faecalibaculum rodentium]